jgi:hypothetical protein
MSYISLRDGEKVRNTWDCEFRKENAPPAPGLLVLTNRRVVALEGTDLSGFWDYRRPRNWIVVIDRDLPDIPPVARSNDTEGTVYLFIAGRSMGLRTALAYAAMSDIEHTRTQASAPVVRHPSGPHEKEIIIKEVVKIPCKYCGKLNLQSDKKCSSCGASIG